MRMKISFLKQGEFPLKLFLITLLFRLIDLIFVNSTYVADEYWQSLEVAHKRAFGYGELTWEWNKGIRSYAYVLVISGLYQCLSWFHWDTPLLLTLIPRLLQGITSAIADVYFVRWIHEKRAGHFSWAFFSWLTCFFIPYCSTRTLINTLEMNLTTIALYYYPWTPKANSFVFMTLVSILCFIRPTAFIIWAPLLLINVISAKKTIRHIFINILPVASIVALSLVAIDSYAHGSLVVTPWNFFLLNVYENIGSHYGSEGLLWYFWAGLPGVLGLHIIPWLLGVVSVLSRMKTPRRLLYDVDSQMVLTTLWSMTVLSFIEHKEFRFLLPLVPMCLYISSGILSKWSLKASHISIYALACTLIVTNYSTLLFLGNYHNAGGLPAMQYLRSSRPNSILFLTPCHRLPLYSHLHSNVTTDYIKCLPNFDHIPDYKDESDIFFADPRNFLKEKYKGTQPCALPSHLIAYDTLNITNFLALNSYALVEKLFDSYTLPEFKAQHINIYQRKGNFC